MTAVPRVRGGPTCCEASSLLSPTHGARHRRLLPRRPKPGVRVTDRLWGLPFLLMGLVFVLMPRDRWRREAEADARRLQRLFPSISVEAEVRTQMVLRWIVPPIFIVFGVLTLLGVIHPGLG